MNLTCTTGSDRCTYRNTGFGWAVNYNGDAPAAQEVCTFILCKSRRKHIYESLQGISSVDGCQTAAINVGGGSCAWYFLHTWSISISRTGDGLVIPRDLGKVLLFLCVWGTGVLNMTAHVYNTHWLRIWSVPHSRFLCILFKWGSQSELRSVLYNWGGIKV